MSKLDSSQEFLQRFSLITDNEARVLVEQSKNQVESSMSQLLHEYIDGKVRGEALGAGSSLEKATKLAMLYNDVFNRDCLIKEINRYKGWSEQQKMQNLNADNQFGEAEIEFKKGRFNKAGAKWGTALQTYKQLGNLHRQGETILKIGYSYANLANYSEATNYYKQALDVYTVFGCQQERALWDLGYGSLRLGDYHSAIASFQQAVNIVDHPSLKAEQGGRMKITANGIDIHYTIEGEGPVVTMSHALGCNLSLWDEQAQALSGRYRVLRYDTRGHGGSSAPPGPYSLEQMADDLHGLLTALGIAQTHFVGISMGGMIGQLFALKYPNMLSSLTLCSTTSRYPAATRSAWVDRIRTVETQGMEPMVEPALQRWFTPPFFERQPDVMDRVRVMIRSTPSQGYIGCCYAIPTIDVTDRLAEVQCPILIIAGKDDPGTPVAMARDIQAALPSPELTILSPASHLCNLEQSEKFNRVLLGFLDKVSRKRDTTYNQ